MQLKSLVLAMLSSASMVAAYDSYYCLFAQDKTGMHQDPYCCEDLHHTKYGHLSLVTEKCHDQSKDVVETCPNGDKPRCCYTIGKEYICTSYAHPQNEADI